MDTSIKIGVLEDDKVIRTNLIRYFKMESDFHIVLQAFSYEDYKSQQQNEFKLLDILLLDIGLPGQSGIAALPEILAVSPNLNVVILTTFEEEDIILKAMAQGAVAYISKKSSLEQIVDAIRIVANGGSYMSPSIARDVFNYMVRTKSKNRQAQLSDRQTEVLDFLVQGKSATQIGKELFISGETVRSHVKNIYQKLKVKNKAEAISKYFESNMHRRT